jgi:hypothetical protein
MALFEYVEDQRTVRILNGNSFFSILGISSICKILLSDDYFSFLRLFLDRVSLRHQYLNIHQLGMQKKQVSKRTFFSAFSNQHGYNVRNIDNIWCTYRCQFCSFILRQPVQLECGHRLCRSCIDIQEG